MKALLQIALWVWWAILIVPALVCLSVIEETKAPSYKTVTFNFEGATTVTYSQFLTSMRNQLKSKDLVQGLPVTRKTVPVAERYLLVDLKINSQDSITIAIDVTDLYVVAYRDRFQQKDRANFLRDAPKVAKDNLFQGATVRNIGFGGNYIDLEGKATGRENIELGVDKLKYAIQSVFGKPPASLTPKIEARFFIISIQMISEAARFQYILNKVLGDGTYTSYKPDPKARNLQNNWGKISEAIHKSSSAGNISPPLQLVNADNTPRTINQVRDIAPDMGLLKFKG